VKNGKNGDDKGAPGISQLVGMANLQSTPDADNPHYAVIQVGIDIITDYTSLG